VRAFVGIGGLLVATIAPAALLGGCTMQSVSAGGGMTQPAPRARLTTGVTSYASVNRSAARQSRGRELADVRRTYTAGLQPTRPDHQRQREGPSAGVELLHRVPKAIKRRPS